MLNSDCYCKKTPEPEETLLGYLSKLKGSPVRTQVQDLTDLRHFMVTCPSPTHPDLNPSCRVDLEQGMYLCLACNAVGEIPEKFRVKPMARYRVTISEVNPPPGGTACEDIVLTSNNMEVMQERGIDVERRVGEGDKVHAINPNGQERACIRLWDGCMDYSSFQGHTNSTV